MVLYKLQRKAMICTEDVGSYVKSRICAEKKDEKYQSYLWIKTSSFKKGFTCPHLTHNSEKLWLFNFQITSLLFRPSALQQYLFDRELAKDP